MADISKITLPSGSIYNIKDQFARDAISQIIAGGLTYVVVNSLPTPSSTTMGAIYLVPNSHGTNDNHDEYMTIKSGTDASPVYNWEKIGSTAVDLDGYAKKGDPITLTTANATLTATGITVADHTVEQGTFTGTEKQVSVTGTPTGTVAISKGTGTSNYTPEGTVTAPTITVTPATSDITPVTDVGTLPVLTTTVTDENLKIEFSQGTLPTVGAATAFVTGITSATATQPTFAGTAVHLDGTFTGDALTSTGNYKPEGSMSGIAVSQHSVTDGGHTHTVTGVGTINT